MIFAKKRPYFFSSIFAGAYGFVLFVPIIIITILNLSDYIIFETSEVHFYVMDNTEDNFLDDLKQSIKYFEIEKLVKYELTNTQKHKKVSFYFTLKSNENSKINRFVKKLKSNDSLLLTGENYQSHLNEGYMKFNYLIISQFITILLFYYIYYSISKTQTVLTAGQYLNPWFMVKAAAMIAVMVILVNTLFILVDYSGGGLTEAKAIYDGSMDYNWQFYISVLILAPIVEELVFRGIIYKNFLAMNIPMKGALFTSVLFALLHQVQIWQTIVTVKIFYFLIMFMISMLFCWLYQKCLRLWVLIFAHAFYNCLMLLMDF